MTRRGTSPHPDDERRDPACSSAETAVERCPCSVWNVQLLLTLAGVLLLLLATWPLWQPGGPFPRIPLLSFALAWPAAGSWLLFCVLLAALGGGVATGLAACLRCRHAGAWRKASPVESDQPATSSPGDRLRFLGRAVAGLVAVLLLLLVVIDQHRLQAWVWHLGLLCGLLALEASPRALQRTCWLTASIYCWSAWQKIDASYFQTAGPYLLDGLLGSVGLSQAGWPPGLRTLAVGLLPAGELAVGLGLLLPRTRHLAALAACVMHALLLLTLGPFGLDHSVGVLLWNVFFIVQNLLFLRNRERRNAENAAREPAGQPPAGRAGATARLAVSAATALLLGAIVLPLLEPLGLCDSWLAWNLYSSRAEQVQLSVRCELRARLPEDVQTYVDSAEPGRLWCRLHDDQWSLATTSAPVTPDARYRVGLALAVARMIDSPDGVRVTLHSQPDRRTGRREHRELYGTAEIGRWLRSRRLNGEPAK